MNYEVIATPKFKGEIKRLTKKYISLKLEFAELIKLLAIHPDTGESLGNHCYKIRLAIKSKGKGKSGGARVITYVYVSEKQVYLLSIYDKSEQSTLSQKELANLLSQID
ncbi:MAG: type II toxin-antitoxin system RelE/ParE family toxin [Bacteroidetes bacterium]|nr:type II toxin-antitoxin system RelE/ParE family toxin [Bacteroidota bacterium]